MKKVLLVMLVLLCLYPSWVFGQPCTHYAAQNGNGDGSSESLPYRITNFLQTANPGNVLCLANGTYTGNDNMIQLWWGRNGTSTQPITIKASTDGGVFINGENQRYPFIMKGASWYIVEGIDFANSSYEAMNFMPSDGGTPSNNNIVRRVCAWNAQPPEQISGFTGNNIHVIQMWNSENNTLEDICGFGYGRNTFIDFDPGTHSNTYRRMWLRWDGWADGNGATCPGGTIQGSYHTRGNSRYENIITVFSGHMYNRAWQVNPGTPCPSLGSGNSFRDGVLLDNAPFAADGKGYTNRGLIDYGYATNADIVTPGSISGWFARWVPNSWIDVFTDGRHKSDMVVGPYFTCDKQMHWGDPPPDTYEGNHCELGTAMGGWDRFTTLRNPGQSVADVPGLTTNRAICTDSSNCPNFYKGDGPAQGSRACHQYMNGTLDTTKPLWPWLMDDRIKQALQRANTAGSSFAGALGLQGDGGNGYAAGTVTSEIAFRYGPIPDECTRFPGTTPSKTQAVFYISPTGLDTRTCEEAKIISTPKQSLASVGACAAGGSTIRMLSGTYPSTVWLNGADFESGTAILPTVITNHLGSTPVLSTSGQRTVEIVNKSYIRVQGLTIDAGGSGTNAVFLSGTTGILLSNNEIRNAQFGVVRIAGGTDTALQGNIVHGGDLCILQEVASLRLVVQENVVFDCNKPIFIWSGSFPTNQAADVIVSRNEVRQAKGTSAEAGIATMEGSNHVIANNVIWGNYGGVRTGFNCTGCKVYNNTIHQNTGSRGVIIDAGTSAEVKNNIIWENGVDAILDGGTGTVLSNNLFVEPLFVDEGLHNYQLTATSPARNAGVEIAGIVADKGGRPRPQGSSTDIGAWEYLETGIVDCITSRNQLTGFFTW